MILAEIGPLDVDPTTIAVYVLIGVIVMLSALVMSWALVAAAKRPPPAALITALSMLTLFAIAGGIATSNAEAWTIAAAGVGALSGSVTSMFQEGRYKILEQALHRTQEAVEQVKENGNAVPPVAPDDDSGGGSSDHPDHPAV